MTPEREQMHFLCLRIQEEKDPKVFNELVHELNELLERQMEGQQKQIYEWQPTKSRQ